MHFQEALVKAPFLFAILVIPGGLAGFLWMVASRRKMERSLFERLELAAGRYKDALNHNSDELEEAAERFEILADAASCGLLRFWLWPGLEGGLLFGLLFSIPLTLISCSGLLVGGGLGNAIKCLFDYIIFPGGKTLFVLSFGTSALTLLNIKPVPKKEIESVIQSIALISKGKRPSAKQLA